MSDDEFEHLVTMAGVGAEKSVPPHPTFHSFVPNAELETLMEIKRLAMELTDTYDNLVQYTRVYGTYGEWDAMQRAREAAWQKLLYACRRAKEKQAHE